MKHTAVCCPVCGMGSLERRSYEETFDYKGGELHYARQEDVCDVCATASATQELIRENVRAKQAAKNAYDGLLLGEQIKGFRENYSISQNVAAKLFGGGEVAFSKYEADDISHNVSMDRLLRLCIEAPENLVRLSAIAGVPLAERTIEQIQSRSEDFRNYPSEQKDKFSTYFDVMSIMEKSRHDPFDLAIVKSANDENYSDSFTVHSYKAVVGSDLLREAL